MSLSVNCFHGGGNVTRDPQVRFLANEKAVASFGIAINRKYKAGDETKEEVCFIDCEAWGRTGELCGQYLTKGSPVYVQGRLKQEQWEDKKDGSKRSKIVLVIDNVQFLGQKGERQAPAEGGTEQAPSRPARPAAPASDVDGEPPF